MTSELAKADIIAALLSVGLCLLCLFAFAKGKIPRDFAIFLTGLTTALVVGIASWTYFGDIGGVIIDGLFMAIVLSAGLAGAISNYTKGKK
jgi:hypothetical protein